jgi:hypothetical protein
VRDQAYQEYNAAWDSVLTAAKGLVDKDGDNLARVLNLLQKPHEPNSNGEFLDRFGFRLCGQRVKGVSEHSYEAPLFEMQLQGELLRAVDADTSSIVELGSGYGKNLFRIWLNGGPRAANYVGAEYTECGRQCAEFLASLEPRIKFHTLPFDFYTPDLSNLGQRGKTFVFTCYALEQIPTAHVAMFAPLLRMPDLYRVVHIEPIGWQRKVRGLPWSSERVLLTKTRESALESQYNSNLLSVLQSLEMEKKIVIEEIKYDFLAHRPDLPGTVIIWRPKEI